MPRARFATQQFNPPPGSNSKNSNSYNGSIIRGQNKIEMKIGSCNKTNMFTPTAPLQSYKLSGLTPSASSPQLNQPPQRIVELLNNQVKQLQQQKNSTELVMMELKNEMTEERHRHQLVVEKMKQEMRSMQEKHFKELKKMERENYIIQV